MSCLGCDGTPCYPREFGREAPQFPVASHAGNGSTAAQTCVPCHSQGTTQHSHRLALQRGRSYGHRQHRWVFPRRLLLVVFDGDRAMPVTAFTPHTECRLLSVTIEQSGDRLFNTCVDVDWCVPPINYH